MWRIWWWCDGQVVNAELDPVLPPHPIRDIAKTGFTSVWLPPPSESVSPQGYLPGDLYKLDSVGTWVGRVDGSRVGERMDETRLACSSAGI